MNLYSRYLILSRALLVSATVGWLLNNWLGYIAAIAGGLYALYQGIVTDNPLKTDAERVLETLDKKRFEDMYLQFFHALMSALAMGVVIMFTIKSRSVAMLAATVTILSVAVFGGIIRK